MRNDQEYSRVSRIVAENKSFCICLPTVLNADSVAAAVSLYIGLSKLGREVTIASAGEWTGQEIIGGEKIQNEISTKGDNLVISFPYESGEIDKITSDVSAGSLNIYVYPQQGHKSPDPTQVKYRYKGGKVDAMFILDSPSLKSLGELHSDNESLFSGVDIINIDRHFTNANFGSVNIVDKQASSLSQIIFDLLTVLKAPIDADIATNLYVGLTFATKNFTAYTVSPQAFELAAVLMKAGARVRPAASAPSQFIPRQGGFPGVNNNFPRPQAQQTQPRNDELTMAALYGESPMPAPQNTPVSNMPTAPAEFEPYEEALDENAESASDKTASEAPAIETIERKEDLNDTANEAKNILKPNIFKNQGGTGNLV